MRGFGFHRLRFPGLRRLLFIVSGVIGFFLLLVLAGYAYMTWSLWSRTVVAAGWTIAPTMEPMRDWEIRAHGFKFTIHDAERVLLPEDGHPVSIHNFSAGLRYDFYPPEVVDWAIQAHDAQSALRTPMTKASGFHHSLRARKGASRR